MATAEPLPSKVEAHFGSLQPVHPLQWAGLALTLALASLPFLGKAYHIDDVLYLTSAKRILETGDPYAGKVLWDAEDGQPNSLFLTDYNPPLWKFALAGLLATVATDEAEWKLHLAESTMVWLGGLALFYLARRWTSHPWAAVTLILWSPFFLPGQNVMLEGPLLAAWAWSLEFACRALEKPNWVWGWLAGALALVAIGIKYSAVLLLPILALAAWWGTRQAHPEQTRERGKDDWGLLLQFVLPATLGLLAWQTFCILWYGQTHLGSYRVEVDWSDWPGRSMTVLRCLGGVTLIGPGFAWILLRSGRPAAWLMGIVPLAIGLGIADALWAREQTRLEFNWSLQADSLVHYAAMTSLGTLGLASLVALAVTGWRPWGRLDGWLLAWSFLVAGFVIAGAPFVAIRHLLWMAIPLTILLVRHWPNGNPWDGRFARGGIILSTVLGFGLAWSDYEFANTYRTLADTEVRAKTAQGTVWYTGTWGFSYYAERAGALPWLEEPANHGLPTAKQGDWLVVPMLLSWRGIPTDQIGPPTEHWMPESLSPLTTIAPGVHFYAVQTWSLPWRVLVRPPTVPKPGTYFEFPPIDDVLVYPVFPPQTHPEPKTPSTRERRPNP